MKNKWVSAYMDMAERFSKLSSAVRLKVGAIVVKNHRVISIGYNGTPEGWSNECEEKVWTQDGDYYLKTKDEVIHAEANAILKLAKDGESGNGATLFLTHSPCIECSKMIYGAGIREVFYKNQYRDGLGIEFLKKCGVIVNKT